MCGSSAACRSRQITQDAPLVFLACFSLRSLRLGETLLPFWEAKDKDSRQDAKSAKEERKEERIGHGTGRCPFSVRIRKLRFWFLLCVSSEKITDLPGNRDGPKTRMGCGTDARVCARPRSRSCSHWWRPMPPTFIFYGWPEPAMGGLSAFICGQFSCSKNQNGRR